MEINPLATGRVATFYPPVTIYRFKKYDIGIDDYVESKRWVTNEGLKKVGGVPVETRQVPGDQVNAWGDDLSPVDWNPK